MTQNPTPKKRRYFGLIRTISLVLILCLVFQEFSYASPQELKKIVDLGSWMEDGGEKLKQKEDLNWAKKLLPTIPESVATIEDAYQAPSVSEQAGPVTAPAPLLSRVASLTSKEVGRPGSVPPAKPLTVILIQDAHTNSSAQLNESKLFNLLFERGITNTVFTEAAKGNVNLTFLRDKASLSKRQQIAKEYLQKGLLHGIEYLDLTSTHNFKVEGVEDPDLYFKSLKVYKDSVKKRDSFERYLNEIESTIDVLKSKLLNPFLLSFLQTKDKQKDNLSDYIQTLLSQASTLKINLTQYPNLKKLNTLKTLESKIDFKQASLEQQKALQSLSSQDQQDLKDITLSKLNLKDSQRGFFLILEDKLKDKTKNYPELTKYLNYLNQSKSLNPKHILEEQKTLEEEVLKALTTNIDEEKLLQSIKTLTFYKKLFYLSLTPEEYQQSKKQPMTDLKVLSGFLNLKLMNLKTRYDKAIFLKEDFTDTQNLCTQFYELTYQRDKAFTENMKAISFDKKTAVLITGGYHTPNLKYLLKQQNISYISVTPQVLHETNIKRYEEILLNQPIPQNSSLHNQSTTSKQMMDFPFTVWGAQLGNSDSIKLLNQFKTTSYPRGGELVAPVLGAARLAVLLESLKSDEYAVSGPGLNGVFDNAIKTASLLQTEDYLGDPTKTDVLTKTLGKGKNAVIFTRRKSGTNTVWSFPQSDKLKLAKLLDVTLKEDFEDSAFLELMDISDAVALLGRDPLRLVQWLRIYHPELSPEALDRVAAVSISGLGGVVDEEEAYWISYEESLAEPTLSNIPQSTDSHSFILKGKASKGTSFIQVEGAYTRKVRVKDDGSFEASIPLPKTGEKNLFRIFAVNHESETKSKSIELEISQTSPKENVEDAFLRLLALKEEVLRSVQKDPARFEFLLRSVELALLGHFTYSEEEGFTHLETLIRRESSKAQQAVLRAVLKEFRTIHEIQWPLKENQRLYFFQKYTIYKIWGAQEKGETGLLVANEQGLGKTITALVAMNDHASTILTPNSVVTTWAEQEEEFLPQPKLAILRGSSTERMRVLEENPEMSIVTNIEFVRGVSGRKKELLSRPQGMLVVDEADFLGSASSQQAQGTRELNASFKLLLSATPFKRISQIRELFSFMYPQDPRFNSAQAFARAFPANDPMAMNALFILFLNHSIRIRKKDVFKSYDRNIPLEDQSDRLPEKVQRPLEEGQFYLSKEQMDSIHMLFTDYQAWCRIHKGHESDEDRSFYRFQEGFFSKREALRQIMNDPAYISRPEIESPKHQKMDEIIQKEMKSNPKAKAVIFVRYKAQVEEYLKRYSRYNPRAYYGDLRQNSQGYRTNEQDRVLYYEVDEYDNYKLRDGKFIPSDKTGGKPIQALDYERILFQNDSQSQIMIATYDTGAVGVTFTAADAVIFDDLAPTYRDQYQAADRAHRIDNWRKKYEVRYYTLQAHYPQEQLKRLPPKDRKEYFDVGTYDQVHSQNLQRQAKIFHRIMDGVGSEEELLTANALFLKNKMPFLFKKGESDMEEAKPTAARLASRRRASPDEVLVDGRQTKTGPGPELPGGGILTAARLAWDRSSSSGGYGKPQDSYEIQRMWARMGPAPSSKIDRSVKNKWTRNLFIYVPALLIVLAVASALIYISDSALRFLGFGAAQYPRFPVISQKEIQLPSIFDKTEYQSEQQHSPGNFRLAKKWLSELTRHTAVTTDPNFHPIASQIHLFRIRGAVSSDEILYGSFLSWMDSKGDLRAASKQREIPQGKRTAEFFEIDTMLSGIRRGERYALLRTLNGEVEDVRWDAEDLFEREGPTITALRDMNPEETVRLSWKVRRYTQNKMLEFDSSGVPQEEIDTIPEGIRGSLDQLKSLSDVEKVTGIGKIFQDHFEWALVPYTKEPGRTWGQTAAKKLERGKILCDCDVLAAYAKIFAEYVGLQGGVFIGFLNVDNNEYLTPDEGHGNNGFSLVIKDKTYFLGFDAAGLVRIAQIETSRRQAIQPQNKNTPQLPQPFYTSQKAGSLIQLPRRSGQSVSKAVAESALEPLEKAWLRRFVSRGPAGGDPASDLDRATPSEKIESLMGFYEKYRGAQRPYSFLTSDESAAETKFFYGSLMEVLDQEGQITIPSITLKTWRSLGKFLSEVEFRPSLYGTTTRLFGKALAESYFDTLYSASEAMTAEDSSRIRQILIGQLHGIRFSATQLAYMNTLRTQDNSERGWRHLQELTEELSRMADFSLPAMEKIIKGFSRKQTPLENPEMDLLRQTARQYVQYHFSTALSVRDAQYQIDKGDYDAFQSFLTELQSGRPEVVKELRVKFEEQIEKHLKTGHFLISDGARLAFQEPSSVVMINLSGLTNKDLRYAATEAQMKRSLKSKRQKSGSLNLQVISHDLEDLKFWTGLGFAPSESFQTVLMNEFKNPRNTFSYRTSDKKIHVVLKNPVKWEERVFAEFDLIPGEGFPKKVTNALNASFTVLDDPTHQSLINALTDGKAVIMPQLLEISGGRVLDLQKYLEVEGLSFKGLKLIGREELNDQRNQAAAQRRASATTSTSNSDPNETQIREVIFDLIQAVDRVTNSSMYVELTQNPTRSRWLGRVRYFFNKLKTTSPSSKSELRALAILFSLPVGKLSEDDFEQKLRFEIFEKGLKQLRQKLVAANQENVDRRKLAELVREAKSETKKIKFFAATVGAYAEYDRGLIELLYQMGALWYYYMTEFSDVFQKVLQQGLITPRGFQDGAFVILRPESGTVESDSRVPDDSLVLENIKIFRIWLMDTSKNYQNYPALKNSFGRIYDELAIEAGEIIDLGQAESRFSEQALKDRIGRLIHHATQAYKVEESLFYDAKLMPSEIKQIKFPIEAAQNIFDGLGLGMSIQNFFTDKPSAARLAKKKSTNLRQLGGAALGAPKEIKIVGDGVTPKVVRGRFATLSQASSQEILFAVPVGRMGEALATLDEFGDALVNIFDETPLDDKRQLKAAYLRGKIASVKRHLYTPEANLRPTNPVASLMDLIQTDIEALPLTGYELGGLAEKDLLEVLKSAQNYSYYFTPLYHSDASQAEKDRAIEEEIHIAQKVLKKEMETYQRRKKEAIVAETPYPRKKMLENIQTMEGEMNLLIEKRKAQGKSFSVRDKRSLRDLQTRHAKLKKATTHFPPSAVLNNFLATLEAVIEGEYFSERKLGELKKKLSGAELQSVGKSLGTGISFTSLIYQEVILKREEQVEIWKEKIRIIQAQLKLKNFSTRSEKEKLEREMKSTQYFVNGVTDMISTIKSYLAEIIAEKSGKAHETFYLDVEDNEEGFVLFLDSQIDVKTYLQLKAKYGDRLRGIISTQATLGSHWVIVSQSAANPPAILLVSDESAIEKLKNIPIGTEMIVQDLEEKNGSTVFVHPTPWRLKAVRTEEERQRLENLMADGQKNRLSKIPLLANITPLDPEEAVSQFSHEGSGLVRTEVWDDAMAAEMDGYLDIFMDDPNTADQWLLDYLTEQYKQVLSFASFRGKKVTFRTFDIAYDKNPAFIAKLKEIAKAHPDFFGEKPLQFGFDFYRTLIGRRMLAVQIAAFHQAHASIPQGDRAPELRIMFPLVISSEDFRTVAKRGIRMAGVMIRGQKASGPRSQSEAKYGVMIETPEAVKNIGPILKDDAISFISVGTNDLTQGIMEKELNRGRAEPVHISRDSPAYEDVFSQLQKPVLIALRSIARAVAERNKNKRGLTPVEFGICGELAGSDKFLLFAENLRQTYQVPIYLSMSANRIPMARVILGLAEDGEGAAKIKRLFNRGSLEDIDARAEQEARDLLLGSVLYREQVEEPLKKWSLTAARLALNDFVGLDLKSQVEPVKNLNRFIRDLAVNSEKNFVSSSGEKSFLDRRRIRHFLRRVFAAKNSGVIAKDQAENFVKNFGNRKVRVNLVEDNNQGHLAIINSNQSGSELTLSFQRSVVEAFHRAKHQGLAELLVVLGFRHYVMGKVVNAESSEDRRITNRQLAETILAELETTGQPRAAMIEFLKILHQANSQLKRNFLHDLYDNLKGVIDGDPLLDAVDLPFSVGLEDQMTELVDAAHTLQISNMQRGQRFGPTIDDGSGELRFEIVNAKPLGSGAFGTTYKAYDHVLKQLVAVKVIEQKVAETTVNRLMTEWRAMRGVASAYAPIVYYKGGLTEENPSGYIVMTFAQGQSLTEAMKDPRLTPALKIQIAQKIAEGLLDLSHAGIIHRDIKPDNIVVKIDWTSGRILSLKIIDFGLAKLMKQPEDRADILEADLAALVDSFPQTYTQTGVIFGTFPYLPPERGMTDREKQDGLHPTVDVFALGVILYSLFTDGRLPGTSNARGPLNPVAIMIAQSKVEYPLPIAIDPQIDPELNYLIMKFLSPAFPGMSLRYFKSLLERKAKLKRWDSTNQGVVDADLSSLVGAPDAELETFLKTATDEQLLLRPGNLEKNPEEAVQLIRDYYQKHFSGARLAQIQRTIEEDRQFSKTNPFITRLQEEVLELAKTRKVYEGSLKDRFNFLMEMFSTEYSPLVNSSIRAIYKMTKEEVIGPGHPITSSTYRKVASYLTSIDHNLKLVDYHDIRLAMSILFDLFEDEANLLEQQYLIDEMEKEIQNPGSGDIPTVAAIHDIHNTPDRLNALIAFVLERKEDGLTTFDSNESFPQWIQSLPSEERVKISRLVRVVGLTNRNHRGLDPEGIKTSVEAIRSLDIDKPIIGQHDFFRILAVLRAQSYFEARGIDPEAPQHRGHHPASRAQEAFTHPGWGDIDIDVLNQQRLRQEVDRINVDITALNSKRPDGQKITLLEYPDIMSARKEFQPKLAEIKKLNLAIQARNRKRWKEGRKGSDEQEETLPDISTITKSRTQKFVSDTQTAIDRINRSLKSSEAPVSSFNISLLDSTSILSEPAIVNEVFNDLQHFNLSYVDVYGNLHMHVIVPYAEDGSFNVSYKGLQGMEAIELMAQDIRVFFEDVPQIQTPEQAEKIFTPEFQERMWSQLGEAFFLISQWYSDKREVIEEKAVSASSFLRDVDVQKFVNHARGRRTKLWSPRQSHGFFIFGDEERSELESLDAQVPWILSYPQFGSALMNINYGLHNEFNRGAILTFSREGMRLYGFRPGSDKVEDITFDDLNGLNQEQMNTLRRLSDGPSFMRWYREHTYKSLADHLQALIADANRAGRPDKATYFKEKYEEINRKALVEAFYNDPSIENYKALDEIDRVVLRQKAEAMDPGKPKIERPHETFQNFKTMREWRKMVLDYADRMRDVFSGSSRDRDRTYGASSVRDAQFIVLGSTPEWILRAMELSEKIDPDPDSQHEFKYVAFSREKNEGFGKVPPTPIQKKRYLEYLVRLNLDPRSIIERKGLTFLVDFASTGGSIVTFVNFIEELARDQALADGKNPEDYVKSLRDKFHVNYLADVDFMSDEVTTDENSGREIPRWLVPGWPPALNGMGTKDPDTGRITYQENIDPGYLWRPSRVQFVFDGHLHLLTRSEDHWKNRWTPYFPPSEWDKRTPLDTPSEKVVLTQFSLIEKLLEDGAFYSKGADSATLTAARLANEVGIFSLGPEKSSSLMMEAVLRRAKKLVLWKKEATGIPSLPLTDEKPPLTEDEIRLDPALLSLYRQARENVEHILNTIPELFRAPQDKGLAQEIRDNFIILGVPTPTRLLAPIEFSPRYRWGRWRNSRSRPILYGSLKDIAALRSRPDKEGRETSTDVRLAVFAVVHGWRWHQLNQKLRDASPEEARKKFAQFRRYWDKKEEQLLTQDYRNRTEKYLSQDKVTLAKARENLKSEFKAIHESFLRRRATIGGVSKKVTDHIEDIIHQSVGTDGIIQRGVRQTEEIRNLRDVVGPFLSDVEAFVNHAIAVGDFDFAAELSLESRRYLAFLHVVDEGFIISAHYIKFIKILVRTGQYPEMIRALRQLVDGKMLLSTDPLRVIVTQDSERRFFLTTYSDFSDWLSSHLRRQQIGMPSKKLTALDKRNFENVLEETSALLEQIRQSSASNDGTANAARLASQPTFSDPEPTISFIVEVFNATHRSGAIVVGKDEFHLVEKNGHLFIYSAEGEEIRALKPSEYQNVTSTANSKSKSFQVSLSMSDLNRLLGSAHRKVADARIRSDDDLAVDLLINTDDFDPGQGLHEAILPLMIEVLKFIHRQKYGQKARFFVTGSFAEEVIEKINQGLERPIAFSGEDRLESPHQIRMTTPKAGNIDPTLRRFYLATPQKGDIPNFLAAARLALALARLEEVNAQTLQSSNVAELLRAFIENVDLEVFSRAVVALETELGKITTIVLPSIARFPINQWIQAARLAERTTAQAA